MKIGSVVKNKVIIYLASRYITYAVQFVTSLAIAAKLGPYYMGIWGFVLLMLNYLGQFHFGIANSLNVLLIQHRDTKEQYNRYITNSLLLMLLLSLLIGVLYLYYIAIGIPAIEEHQAGRYVWAVALIAIFQYFNGIFANIFRVKNMLNSISLTQSLVVLLPFLVLFFFRDSQLIDALVASYVISNLLCTIYALKSGIIPRLQIDDIKYSIQKEILIKGIFLFLYNTCFAFIVISLRTIVSLNYSIEEFGLFTFAYTLGNAVMMLMDAFSFIAFPKVVSIFGSEDNGLIKEKMFGVRTLYMSAAHFLTYIVLPLMSLLSFVMPQYQGSVVAFNLIVLALALNTGNFAYSSLLIARNKEKISAVIALTTLIINVSIALILVKLFHVGFSNVAIATLIANFFICVASYYFCSKLLKIKMQAKNIIPIRLLIPYCVALTVSLSGVLILLWLPVVIFIILNIPTIKTLAKMLFSIAKDSTIINVK